MSGAILFGGKAMSNLTNLDEVKSKLTAEKERLEAELKSYKSEDPFLSGQRDLEINTTDNDSIENESHDRIAATRNALKEYLSRVLAALERIESGTYGLCRVDSGPIEPERLTAQLTATTCLKHAKS